MQPRRTQWFNTPPLREASAEKIQAVLAADDHVGQGSLRKESQFGSGDRTQEGYISAGNERFSDSPDLPGHVLGAKREGGV